MTLLVTGLATVAGGGLSAAAAGALAPPRWRPAATGALGGLTGLGGVLAGAAALGGQTRTVRVPHLLPLSSFLLTVDPLAGAFLLGVGLVVLCAAVYGAGYTAGESHGAGSRTAQALVPVFATAMLLVPVAGNVTTFLLLWELMALASLVLVLAEHRARPGPVRDAGVWYAGMTHAGLVVILLGLVTFATAAGGESFAALRAAGPGLSPTVRTVVFVLTFLGFAAKAGAVPAHVWLPRAHPEAPSHVSALMSAAMVALGAYGLVRVWFDLLGGGPGWWGVLVLAVGGLSAAYGVLQASVATDLKRLLGYSTTENMGLVLVGLGAAGLLLANGERVVAGLLVAAALLHTLNHAAFKTLLFFGAGSVLRATGLRDLDALGGLAARMPVTTALTAVGALAAAALPPGNGFVSEWLLLQGLVHGLSAGAGVVVTVALPVAVGVVALTAGLGVATFVKAFGVGFLARARSAGAAAAAEGPGALRAGLALAAALTLALGLLPVATAAPLGRVLGALPPFAGTAPLGADLVTLRLAGVTGALSPMLLATGLLLAGAGLAALLRWRARPARTAADLWGCGGRRLDPRMEYTATSFAEPLARVFDDVLRPDQGVDVTHYAESRYLVESVTFRQRVPDRLEARLYPPLWAAAAAWGDRARRLQNGSVHRYLGYGFLGLLAVLVLVGVTG